MAIPAERRVVITGRGVICPLGCTPAALADALAAGASGVRPLEMFDTSSLPMSFGSEAREFTGHISNFGAVEGDLKKAIRKGLKTICREAQMGIAAAQLAMQEAGLAPGGYDPERTGALFGSDYMVTMPEDFIDSVKQCIGPDGKFHFSQWAEQGMGRLNPLWLLKYLPNMPAAHLSMYNDLRGPNNSITEREASANLALGEAARIIARGHADRMVTGATGTWIHPMKTVQAALQFELAAGQINPPKASRPFDKHRSGMVLGEGSGTVILEDLDTAGARGATIYGEVLGSAASQVASKHLVADLEQALVNAMSRALEDAGMEPGEVGHVHAHGLSTQSCDAAEARALERVFGPASSQPPVMAAKSNFGNLGAGSGLVELISSLTALQHGELYPLLNYDTPDPDAPINAVTRAGTPAGESFLSSSISLQGQAGCVVVRRWES